MTSDRYLHEELVPLASRVEESHRSLNRGGDPSRLS